MMVILDRNHGVRSHDFDQLVDLRGKMSTPRISFENLLEQYHETRIYSYQEQGVTGLPDLAPEVYDSTGQRLS